MIEVVESLRSKIIELDSLLNKEERTEEDEIKIESLKKDIINTLTDLLVQVNSL